MGAQQGLCLGDYAHACSLLTSKALGHLGVRCCAKSAETLGSTYLTLMSPWKTVGCGVMISSTCTSDIKVTSKGLVGRECTRCASAARFRCPVLRNLGAEATGIQRCVAAGVVRGLQPAMPKPVLLRSVKMDRIFAPRGTRAQNQVAEGGVMV